jgi:hypothetical protein
MQSLGSSIAVDPVAKGGLDTDARRLRISGSIAGTARRQNADCLVAPSHHRKPDNAG